jgi:uncharacterized membrane protein YgcG
MTYRNLFFSLLMGLLCCIPSITTTGMGMPNMNMDDFEKELAEANRAIEEYVASLPAEEQAEFNRQVEEMSRMFENMSEDEFEQFLGEMFADEPMMMEPNPFDAIQDTPQEEVVEVVLNTEDKKKVETAIAILDDIIKQSNMLMVIVNSSSELPERINQWATKGEIAHWQPDATWVTFKTEIETFIQKLYRAEEQDLTTKKYKYLFELIADEALYNNLIQLRDELKNIIPTIEIPEFSVEKLSSQSKTALKNALGKYTESFYLLDIPKALDTLFEKYAPEEEKIKAAEEAATKRAQEASRATRTPAAKTQAGAEDMGYGYDDYYGGGYDDYYGGGYGNDYGYPSYGSYGGDYGYDSGYGSGGRGGASSGGGRSSGGSGGSDVGKDKEDKEKEEEDKDKKKKKSKKDNYMQNFEVEAAIRDIKKDFEDIKAAMTETEDNPTKLADLQKFAEHITNNDEKIDETLVSYILPRVIDKKIDNISISLKKIDKKELNADDLAHYQKEIKKIFDEQTKLLKPFVDMVGMFETKKDKEAKEAEPHLPGMKEEDQVKKINISELPDVKQWAYFGTEPTDKFTEEENKLTETITPISLFEISKKIVKLLDDVKTFDTKKAKAPRQPVAKQAGSEDIFTMPTPPSFDEQ